MLKVSDYDTKTHWRESIGLERFNNFLQVDVPKRIVRFWKNTKDLAPNQLWGIENYDESELQARSMLAKISGQNPNHLVTQGDHHRKTSFPNMGQNDNTANSGITENDQNDSDSRNMSENDSLKATPQNTSPVPNLGLNEINNRSLQEVQQISDDMRTNKSEFANNVQMSAPMSETMIAEMPTINHEPLHRVHSERFEKGSEPETILNAEVVGGSEELKEEVRVDEGEQNNGSKEREEIKS